ncbi:glutathione S-transferase family protein [Labrys portucalensis]|uniref:glutathione transferase n=1 Tax=Labrys neptuniae TaxID=376174 RepID=A0ABV6ZNE8_9HYPH
MSSEFRPARLTLVSHHLCPYVQRAVIALMEKGAPFQRRVIDLAAKPDWFTALSPLGKVPLLLVEPAGAPQAVLFESSVICEFVEESVEGPKLHPDDPLERARHRGWMEFGSSILADLWGLETATDAVGYERARVRIADKFARVEDVLGNGPYFAGDAFSLVDAVFAPIFRYFDLFDTLADIAVFTALPRVQAWRQALSVRPSVRAAVEPDYPDRLRDFLVRHDAFLLKQVA